MLLVNVVIKILELGNPSHPTNYHPPYPLPIALMLNYPCLDFNLTSWMTPTNLRVLRSEHSSGQLSGFTDLALTKDHLSHVSPLSMAGDWKPRRKRKATSSSALKRKSSWRDTIISGLTSTSGGGGGGNKEDGRRKATVPRRHATNPTSSAPMIHSLTAPPTPRSIEDFGALADAESEDDEEQDRPIEAHVKYVCPEALQVRAVPPLTKTGSALEREQKALEEAVVQANSKAMLAVGMAREKGQESLGTRLTMTSRTGYFLDRIISPTMVRRFCFFFFLFLLLISMPETKKKRCVPW